MVFSFFSGYESENKKVCKYKIGKGRKGKKTHSSFRILCLQNLYLQKHILGLSYWLTKYKIDLKKNLQTSTFD